MTDIVVAYPHPHRADRAVFEILYDPAPGWAKREPYRGREVSGVRLHDGEASMITPSEIRAMHEAAPAKTLQELIDGWRWDRELYWRAQS